MAADNSATSSLQQDGLITTLDSDPHADRPHAEVTTLLQRCSRYEADLQAASWKIQSLTKQLEQHDGGAPGDQHKLEQALRQTHDELAKLRQQLASSGD